MIKKTLFTSADGQVLGISSAKLVSTLPIWEGNRNILEDHVKDIEQSLGDDVERINHTIFRVARVNTEEGIKEYIVDGQHRVKVLKGYFEKNPFNTEFDVLVAVKDFNSEAEIIQHFQDINRTRAIEWKEDPKIIANRFIKALLDEFQPPMKNGKPAIMFFRFGRTRKPYISIEVIRDRLIKKYDGHWTITPEQFVQHAYHHNEKLYQKIMDKPNKSATDMLQVEMGFALANDDEFNWI